MVTAKMIKDFNYYAWNKYNGSNEKPKSWVFPIIEIKKYLEQTQGNFKKTHEILLSKGIARC